MGALSCISLGGRRFMKLKLPLLCCVLFAAGALPAAAAAPSCADPAWAPQRLAGYDLADCQTKSWASVELELTTGNVTVSGRRSTVNYELHAGAKDHSNAAVWGYYLAQAKKAGGVIGSDPKGGWAMVASRKTPQGTEWM